MGAYDNQYGVEIFIAPLDVVNVVSRRHLPEHHIEIETVIAIFDGWQKNLRIVSDTRSAQRSVTGVAWDVERTVLGQSAVAGTPFLFFHFPPP